MKLLTNITLYCLLAFTLFGLGVAAPSAEAQSVYAAIPGSSSVVAIQGSTNSVVATVTIPLTSNANISSITRGGNLVTVTTAAAHNLLATDHAVIAGVTGAAKSFNGTFLVGSITSSTVFTFVQSGGNESGNPNTGTAGPAPWPRFVAITPDARYAYVVDSNSGGAVSVIDTVTNILTSTIPVGGCPAEIAFSPDGMEAYLADPCTNGLTVLNTATHNLLSVSFSSGPGSLQSGGGVAVSPNGTRVYVGTPAGLGVYDTATGVATLVNPAFAGGACGVGEIAATPDGLQLVVTACLDAYALDTATYTPTLLGASRPFSAFCNPGGVAITPDGRTAFVPDSECGGILAIDTASHATSFFFLPGNSQPNARYIAITSDGTRAYASGFDNCCAQQGDGIVGVFDPVSKIGLVSIDVGLNQTIGIAVLPLNNTPVGPNVAVQPLDKITGTSPVTLTFDNVTQAGFTSLVTSSTGPTLPTGFQLAGVYYNLATTAQFTGNITICITSSAVTSASQLWHFGSSGSVDVTSSISGTTICGIVSSLSPFAILRPSGPPPTATAALFSSANPSVYGQNVTFTATLTASGSAAPSGTVTFLDGTTTLATGTLSSGTTMFGTPFLSAGTHSLTASYSGDANFAPSTSSVLAQTVNLAPLTITANNTSRQYGLANPVFNASDSGLVNGDGPTALSSTPLCTSQGQPSSPVGTYAIKCAGVSSSNYAITFAPGTLTITPALLTIAANNASRPYGANNPLLTGAITGLQNGDPITASFTTTATLASPVGTYPITPVVLDPANRLSNYTVMLVNGTLAVFASVTPTVATTPPGKLIVVNNGPGDQSDPHVSGNLVVYSNSDSTNFTVHYFDLATLTDKTVPGSGTGTLDFLSDVRGTTIVFTRLSSSKSAIFSFDTASAQLTEIAAQPTSSRRDTQIGDQTIAWQDFGFSSSASSSDIIAYDRQSGTTTRLANDSALNQSPAISPDGMTIVWAKCAIIISPCAIWQATLSNGTWTARQVSSQLITQAASHPDTDGTIVAYTADAGSGDQLHWQPVTGGTDQVLNLQGGNGSFPSISGGLIAFAYLPANASAHEIALYDVAHNLFYNLTGDIGAQPGADKQLNDISVTPDGQVRVVWQVQQTDLNIYAYTFNLNVPTTTTISAANVTYGTPARVTVSVSSSGGTVSGNVSLTVDGGSAATSTLTNGSAVFNVGVLSAGPHALSANFGASGIFLASAAGGTLSITPAPLTVTAINASRPYGAANPMSFSVNYSGFVNGDTSSVLIGLPSCTTPATPNSTVGTYAIMCAGVSSPNYAISFLNGTLKVVPETTSLNVTISPTSIAVGQSTTVTLTLTAPDMVIAIDPTALASVAVTSPMFVSDILTNNGACALAPAGIGTATCSVTLTAVEPNGHTLLASFPGTTNLVASTNNTAGLIVTAPLESKVSCLKSDFRNVAVPGGSYLWFNSIFKIRDVDKQKVTITFFQSSVQFQYKDVGNNLITVNQALPDAKITIDPSVSTATTMFDAVNNMWITSVPFDIDDATFLTGIAWLVPAGGIPGDIEPVTWCGTFASDTAGVEMGWRWSAAAYSSFSGNNAVLGVKPMNTDHDNPPVNRDLAGTPESYKPFVIPGARGKGGKNYTGSYSGSAEIE